MNRDAYMAAGNREAGKRWITERFKKVAAAADVGVMVLGWSDLPEARKSVLIVLHRRRRIPLTFGWPALEEIPDRCGDRSTRNVAEERIHEVVTELRKRESDEPT